MFRISNGLKDKNNEVRIDRIACCFELLNRFKAQDRMNETLGSSEKRGESNALLKKFDEIPMNYRGICNHFFFGHIFYSFAIFSRPFRMQCAYCEKQEGFGKKVACELELDGARIFVHGNYVSEPPSVDIALGKTGTIRAFFQDPLASKKAYKAFSYACKTCRLDEIPGPQTVLNLGARMTKQLTTWPSSGPETDSDDAPTQRIETEKKPESDSADSASVADTVIEAIAEAVVEAPVPKKRKLEKEPKRLKKVAKTEKQIEKDLDTKLDLVIDTLNALLAVLKKN